MCTVDGLFVVAHTTVPGRLIPHILTKVDNPAPTNSLRDGNKRRHVSERESRNRQNSRKDTRMANDYYETVKTDGFENGDPFLIGNVRRGMTADLSTFDQFNQES